MWHGRSLTWPVRSALILALDLFTEFIASHKLCVYDRFILHVRLCAVDGLVFHQCQLERTHHICTFGSVHSVYTMWRCVILEGFFHYYYYYYFFNISPDLTWWRQCCLSCCAILCFFKTASGKDQARNHVKYEWEKSTLASYRTLSTAKMHAIHRDDERFCKIGET